ncbi:MAG: DUF1615 domain-containing protein [Candidatus Accumulibacter sp. UW20]
MSKFRLPWPAASRLVLMAAVGVTLGGCATEGGFESRPSPALPPLPTVSPPTQPVAPVSQPPPPAIVLPPPVVTPVPVLPPPIASVLNSRALLNRLLPARIADRSGWAADILGAFEALQIPPRAENFCAAIAVIEQESTFQSEPAVAGLSRIVWREIDQRREKYGVPKVMLDLALRKSSPDGRSYSARIDALRTERQMNTLYDDMISELPGGKRLFGGFNPIRTGGPMQVGVDFAEEQIRLRPYPYPRRESVRNEVFTRRGGVYFGIAYLLDYPASYSRMIYRFADFNAGRYSSRNAAFQDAVSRLSGEKLARDGDLLRYRNGLPVSEASATQQAIISLRPRLRLSTAEIVRDLKLEKSFAFERTPLYERLFALADAAGGRRPRELLPTIDLKSPKITRQLTTEWFARRVDGRYRNCLAGS